MSKNKNINVNNHSRKRSRHENDDNDQQQQLSYARRLLHQCKKDLHKQAKVCRNLECQRLARKVKQGQKESQLTLLQKWRHLPLEPVLELCFRRLGMLDVVQLVSTIQDVSDTNKKLKRNQQSTSSSLQVTQNNEESTDHDNKNNSNDDHPSNNQHESTGTHHSDDDNNNDNDIVDPSMLEQILGHKKMRDAMEVWSTKVAEYRKWCTRHLQSRTSIPKDKVLLQKEIEPEEDEVNTFMDTSHSLFMTLGDPKNKDNKKKKKNRPGQKARQAMAAEQYSTTTSTKIKHHSQSQQTNQKTSTTTTTTENEILHPSWQARKAQKVSIASFQGKKITFDTDGKANDEKNTTTSTTTTTTSIQVKSNANKGNDLHPSWEARKAQKNNIVAFQGKKITF